jgi:Ca2+-binding EF-hand superfamily protein
LNFLHSLWHCFSEIDKKKKGAITPAQMLSYIDERESSVIAPAFYRLFEIMQKIDSDEVTFEELIPALLSYCLFTRSEILGFMYSLLDEDKDDFISKTDVFKYLLQMRQS